MWGGFRDESARFRTRNLSQLSVLLGLKKIVIMIIIISEWPSLTSLVETEVEGLRRWRRESCREWWKDGITSQSASLSFWYICQHHGFFLRDKNDSSHSEISIFFFYSILWCRRMPLILNSDKWASYIQNPSFYAKEWRRKTGKESTLRYRQFLFFVKQLRVLTGT